MEEVKAELLVRACSELSRFALGWNMRRLLTRILDICRFAAFTNDSAIPLERRRSIARLADDLLGASAHFGDLNADFLDGLRLVAAGRSRLRARCAADLL